MDRAQQAEGEKRVRRLLVEPLLRRGLVKPATMTKDKFEEMTNELCAKLAYMTELNLAALEEDAAQFAGGKARDRFPIANIILDRAGKIQQPDEGASPLITAVFRNKVGHNALAEGWAPELLEELRHNRKWPVPFMLTMIRERAASPVAQLEKIERALSRGEDVPENALRWRDRRLAVIRKCQDIADAAEGQGGGNEHHG